MDIADMESNTIGVITHHTAASVNQLINTIVNKEFPDVIRKLGVTVCVRGFLGNFDSKKYRIAYAVPLSEDSETIYCDIPVSFLNDFKEGDYVVATGTIIPNVHQSGLKFRLNVSTIRADESPAAIAARRENTLTLSKFKSLDYSRYPFPDKESVVVSLISSSAGRSMVDEDFVNAMEDIHPFIELERIEATMSDPLDIARAIDTARGDILVIARGGGDDPQFAIFDAVTLLETFAKKKVYRVTGLGHSANRTLLDMLADHSATTPSSAGTHIRDKFKVLHEMRRRQSEAAKRQEGEISDLRREISAANTKLGEVFANQKRAESDLRMARKQNSRIVIISLFVGAVIATALRHIL